jgi:hypothetical protein
MASGASGRQSVSPSNEEPYQSPGASQEEGIDHLLAQYSGLVDRRPAGEGEGEGEGGGNGAHRNRSAAVSERPTVSVGAGSQHPPPSHPSRHIHTSSPHHAVSAPTSHQSTPARDEGPAGLAVPSSTGQTGLAGDSRSLSWDNMASGAASAVGSKGEQCMRYRTVSGVYIYSNCRHSWLNGSNIYKEGGQYFAFCWASHKTCPQYPPYGQDIVMPL